MVSINETLIDSFNQLAIHNRIDPFFEDDIAQFFNDPSLFSLNIKRSKDKVSLYSSKHVEIRRQFFNELETDTRVAIFKQKIESVGISDWLYDELKINVADIQSVTDVGKGRTIYKIDLLDGRRFVVKEKTNNLQQTFGELGQLFGISVANSAFVKVGDTFWEVTPFLDEEEVFHFKKDHLFDLYPKAAAFGDFIGLGDRHFENYICKKDQLIAIDVSHLMESENEHWTRAYISGGLYECCLLQYYISDKKQFEHYLERFFTEYITTSERYFLMLDQMDKADKYGDEISALKLKWQNHGQYIQHMQHIYLESLSVMMDRIPYKTVLQQLVKNNVELVDYPELRMYQLADADRISTFFRIEEESLNLFELIEKLALDHLGVTKTYFSDYQQTTNKIRQSLNPRRGTLLFV